MADATYTVGQYAMIGLILGLFAIIGFRRGVGRELVSFAGICLGLLAAMTLAPSLVPLANRGYRLFRLAAKGVLTADDPVPLWQQVKAEPPLISEGEQTDGLAAAVFVIVALVFFGIGQLRIRRPLRFGARLVGALMGSVNGYLTARYLLPILLPMGQAVVSLPTGPVGRTLTNVETTARAALFFIFILVIVGLYSASEARANRREQGGPYGPR